METVLSGTGSGTFALGTDPVLFFVQGADTIQGGSAAATVILNPGDTALVSVGAAPVQVQGGNGQDTVYGDAGGGLFVGGSEGGNLLVAGTGATTIFGIAAGDTLAGGDGSLLVTGAGNETVALAADDTLFAAAAAGDSDFVTVPGTVAGPDFIGLGAGAATLGGLQNATVYGGSGIDSVEGTQLVVWGDTGAMVVSLNGGIQTYPPGFPTPPLSPGQFDEQATDSTVSGGLGSLTVLGAGGGDLLIGGSAGHNLIVGGPSSTLIGGGSGDLISVSAPGAAERDLIVAGPGAELIADNATNSASGFEAGYNTIYGGTGADFVTMNAVFDQFDGGPGADAVTVGAVANFSSVVGGAGPLSVYDEASGCLLVSGSGASTLVVVGGGSVATTLVGTAGGDMLSLQGGLSLAVAGSGNETLQASGYEDTLIAGTGNALLAATPVAFGEDMFGFFAGYAGGADTISGFAAPDMIALGGYGTAAATQTAVGGNANLLLSDGTHIVVLGVASIASSSILSFPT